jgi:hypothetical protein
MKRYIVSAVLILAVLLASCSTPKATPPPVAATDNGTGEVSVDFVNNSSGAVEFFWVDSNSQEVSYGTAAAGETVNMGTFAGHVWHIRDAQGNLIQEYTAAPDAQQTFEITQAMVDAVAPAAQQYFTENFDSQPANWTLYYFPPNGAPITTSPIDKAVVTLADGFLQFSLGAPYTGAFITYDAFDYTDVRLDARIENHGSNTNDLALMCRYSDKGWYEFNVQSDGLWFFNYIETTRADGTTTFHTLDDGGTTVIKQDVNEYGMSCIGDTIVTYINGQQIKVVKDASLTSGKVGIQAFSMNPVPVVLYVDWLTISQP